MAGTAIVALASVEVGRAAEPATNPLPVTHSDCLIEARSMVDLGSAEEGIIHEIVVERGDFVDQGDRVARLEFDLAQLSVELARLRAERTVEVLTSRTRLEFQQREMARMRELHQRDVVSTRSRDEAETEQDLAEHAVRAAELDRREAEVELSRAQASLDRHTIRSPVTGVVSEVLMAPGEYAYEQSPIMRIAEINPLHVEVFLPVSWYQDVFEGMAADVIPEPPVEGSYRALVTVVDRIFDSASGTFGVRLELPNPEFEIPAGLRCTIRFRPDVAVPESAAWSTMDVEIGAITTAAEVAKLPPESVDGVFPALLPTTPAGDGETGVPESTVPAFGDDLTLLIQEKLARAGFDVGPLDGLLGPRTTAAIVSYQVEHGLAPDGRPTRLLYDHLRDLAGEEQGDGLAAETPPDMAGFSATGYDYLRRAAAASDRDDSRLAAFLYSKAIEAGDLAPLHQAYAYNNRGTLERARGQFETAVQDFDRAIALNPDYVAAFMNRAESRFSTDGYAAAIEDYDRAIELTPDLAYAFYRRGMALLELGEIDSAIESHDAAIERSPDLVQAYMGRGIAYRILGRPDEALFNFAKVFEHDPQHPGLRSELQGIGVLECGNATEEICLAVSGLKNDPALQ